MEYVIKTIGKCDKMAFRQKAPIPELIHGQTSRRSHKAAPVNVCDILADVAACRQGAVQSLEAALRQSGAMQIKEIDVRARGDAVYAVLVVVGRKGTSSTSYNSPVIGAPDQVQKSLTQLQDKYNAQ